MDSVNVPLASAAAQHDSAAVRNGMESRTGRRAQPGEVREALRQLWRQGGQPWDLVAAHHRPRNLEITRLFLETDLPATEIATQYGVTRMRISAIAHSVVYGTLGLRLPR